MPPIDTEDLEESDPAQAIEDLMTDLAQYSADELQDQVHRRFEYRICRPCQIQFIANPLGRPRRERPGHN